MTLDRSTLRKHQQNAPALRINAPHAANLKGGGRGGEKGGLPALLTIDWMSERVKYGKGGSPTPGTSADFYVCRRALGQLSRNYLHEIVAAACRSVYRRYQAALVPHCPHSGISPSVEAAFVDRRRFPSKSIIVDNYFSVRAWRTITRLTPRYLGALEIRMT